MISAFAPEGIGEVHAGDDLAALLLGTVGASGLADGDIVCVTSKVVSKAEGRVVAGDRDLHLDEETARVVARRGQTRIVRTRHGLTLAAAGIDASNVEPGHSLLLPVDPDRSARELRTTLADRTGLRVGVLITDTAGRPWRQGQTDIAIGAAGVAVLESFAGRRDAHGNELAVTAPAVADELAGLAELASGKLGARPFVVVRGRDDLVLPADDNGPGAAALIRPDADDMFGYGAREAVVRAVGVLVEDMPPFGATASPDELADALHLIGIDVTRLADGAMSCEPHRIESVAIVAMAHGWEVEIGEPGADLRLRPLSP